MQSVAFYCINLKERHDRKRSAGKLFKRLGLKVHWWTVDRHPEGGRWGCFESHVCIWAHSHADITVIFEDDVQFAGSKEQFRSLLKEAVLLSRDYDTIHLGNVPVSLGRTVSLNFSEGTFVTLSCYLGRTSRLKSLIPKVLSYWGLHLDTVLSTVAQQAGSLNASMHQDFRDSNNPWTDNIPIVSLLEVDRYFRESLQKDSKALLRIPSWIWFLVMRASLALGVFQGGLIGYSPEFRDRRV